MSTHVLSDCWTMTRRELAHWQRRPVQVIVSVVFPLVMLVMFVYFIGGGMGVENYREFLVPGMFALTMGFGLESTMVALTQDLNKGVIDRFRSMPMSQSAVLVGRSAHDMLESAVGLVVLVLAGLLVGWRWHGGPGAVLAALGLLLLLRFAMLWVGIYLGLVAGRPELVQAVQILVWPVAFFSNVFSSPSTMPGWMGTVAEWNPMSATARAVRELFGNPVWGGGSWAAEHATLLAVLWPLALLAVFFPLAVRKYAAMGK
ncbi:MULTISPECIES: ABC transporter permease [unclassified Streptomyces]|uniref:ABC transporter permease n=1 Tax=unclassified Streptomyces TaxID=2593676 RepID=UPI002DD9F832|nr:ABC transporter permease [Streptomyces sp. NBC_01775]WSB77589.1 ABC transporter permease [Streptomyces sp. NBC_01775]WSS42966.1 ABC transporter permease [Streptomyces sp. NBC_01187]